MQTKIFGLETIPCSVLSDLEATIDSLCSSLEPLSGSLERLK
jgi:hypothetical protein